MPEPSILAVGASAGGIEALTKVVRGLTPDLSASMLVAVHVGAQSVLPALIARATPLPATHGLDGEVVLPGHIYVAPPGRHMTIDGDRLRVRYGPRENGSRPAIDPLFRSVARVRGRRVVGVILSGQLDDGVAGLYAIKARGGLAVIQDPGDAPAPSMPRHALRYVDPDYCLPADQIGPLLVKLANHGATMSKQHRGSAPTRAKRQKKVTSLVRASPITGRDQLTAGKRHRAHAPASTEEDPLRCPDCSGPLYQVSEGELMQWACREGHVLSAATLNAAQTEALERALWLAVRTMKERALVDRTVSARFGDKAAATRDRLIERAGAVEKDIELLREILARL